MMLIQYVAAYSGYSRRKAGDLIKDRRVTVNNVVKRKPWYIVQEDDLIAFKGGDLILPKRGSAKFYILLNKPAGVITSMSDEEGRYDVGMLIKGASKERLFPVGRLDKDTTGLLLCTNDGQLAQKLSHPRFSVAKEYAVTLDKPVTPEHLKNLYTGIFLPEGKIRFDRAVYAPKKRKFVVIVEIHSGKKRIIRRLFLKLGYKVRQLDRIGYARLTKRRLKQGNWRKLTSLEVSRLERL